MTALDDPGNELWRGEYDEYVKWLDGIDRAEMEQLLRERPWAMTEELALATVRAGLGFVMP
ncbi:hypothetical protein ACFVU2_18870 [Leifsonia sp. NPDC058194]|uniref:hypothetical protein n=1 Tax=Leifsonia sp. NPDC058194 TaxID=3346374 RepID=UPI0036D7CD58